MLPRPTAQPRRFVPALLDAAKLDQLKPLYEALLDRPLDTAQRLEQWLLDFSELFAVVAEHRSRCYINKSCHTNDAECDRTYLHFMQEVLPRVQPLEDKANKHFLASPALAQLDPQRYEILIRSWRVETELFCEANIPLQSQATALVSQFNKITGGLTVEFDGQQRTMRQLEPYLEQTDRNIRQRAWEARTNRHLQERENFDDIFDKLLTLRHQIAVNAGLDNYRSYTWKWLNRFDYTPQQCKDFSESVARTIVPVIAELNARRKQNLGLDTLRPWDMFVDPKNRPPLEPFAPSDAARLIERTGQIFARLSPELAAQFESMRRDGLLDVESRNHKQPNGYCSWMDESKKAFIFMNSSGTHGNVQTLLHESGHAFHSIAAGEEPLMFLRRAPLEFAEVASMSMELLGGEHFDLFYDQADADRARRNKLESLFSGLPTIAIYDSFQHWLYENPGHSHAHRTAEWVRLHGRFAGDVDWSGYESALEADWQQTVHFYLVPFYYIEYGIAQLGAAQMWLQYRKDPEKTIANYRAALKLGGTQRLPALFAAAGIRFDFSEQTLTPLMEAVAEELLNSP